MPNARYFVPDHPKFTDVYTKDELRLLLQKGELSRSDILCDDETGLAHLLGDLLSTPYPEATVAPSRSTQSSVPPLDSPPPQVQEFRASTPLSQTPLPPRRNSRRDETEEEWEDESDTDADFDDEHPRQRAGETDDDDDLDQSEDRYTDSEEESDDDDAYLDEETDATFEEEDDDHDLVAGNASAPVTTAEERNRAVFPTVVRESMMAQEDDLLYLGHPSWLAYPKALLAFTFFALVSTACWQLRYGLEWVMLFGSIGGLCLLFIALERTTTAYMVSRRRVEMEYGIIGRSTKEVRIEDIRAIDVQQAGFNALLGLGTVSFDSSAGATPEVVFKNVRGPHRIKDMVRGLQG